MGKFATTTRPAQRTPITTTGMRVFTHEGGIGYERDPKSELFLLAVSNMVAEDSFYEKATDRDARYAALVHAVTQTDPAWVAALVPWLRDTANLRSVAVVTACEYVAAGGANGRPVISAACRRADEPAEVLAYWRSRYGRSIPAAVKRGTADAATRLFNETAALRYDGKARPWRLGDVIDLAHPKPVADWQSDLFRHLLNVRHGRDAAIPESLTRLTGRAAAEAVPVADRRAVLAEHVDALGSWEAVSGWLADGDGMTADAWTAAIPTMGIMALLRNLRNFDTAGVTDAAIAPILARFSDPAEVAKSRQLPFRWYSAWREAPSLRWAYGLEQALDASLANVPHFPGRTLVMVDVSGSMESAISNRSQRTRAELAALFGTTVAKRAASADLWAYNGSAMAIDYSAPTLRVVDGIRRLVGGGTATNAALRHCYNGHDRVVLITDEQACDAGTAIPAVPHLHTFNIGGYRPAGTEQGTPGRYAYGGLTDAGFGMMLMLEQARDGAWPHTTAR